MKLLVVAALLAVAAARPQEAPEEYDEAAALRDAGILRLDFSKQDDGSFRYGYVTSDPIVQDASGQQKQIGEQQGIVMQGSYSFVAKDEFGNDVPVEVSWVADENGFQPVSSFIPVAPEDPNRAAQEAAYAAAAAQQQ